MSYKPNPRIVDRAVHLWAEMLRHPVYDNLGKDSREPAESIQANKMASLLTSQLPKNNTEEVLERFGVELHAILMMPQPREYFRGSQAIYYERYLSVDYDPDALLALAAERAGLSMAFPWKTSMSLSEDHLSVSVGYGSDHVYHYPLKNDAWLVTTLCGGDIVKIITLVEAGVLTPMLEKV